MKKQGFLRLIIRHWPIQLMCRMKNWPVGRAVTSLSLKREVWDSNLGRPNRTQYCQQLATTATFFQKKLCCPNAMTWIWAPQTLYTLRRNTANIVKNLIKTALVFLFLIYYHSENLPQMKFDNTGHRSNKQNAQSTSPTDQTRENLMWNAVLTIRSKDN